MFARQLLYIITSNCIIVQDTDFYTRLLYRRTRHQSSQVFLFFKRNALSFTPNQFGNLPFEFPCELITDDVGGFGWGSYFNSRKTVDG